jgi:hypothetical protein
LPVKCIRLYPKEQRILPQMLKSFSSSWETNCKIFSSGKPFVKSSHHLRTQWTHLIMKEVFLPATCTTNLKNMPFYWQRTMNSNDHSNNRVECTTRSCSTIDLLMK